MTTEISKFDDLIDSRYVDARIAELEGERAAWNDAEPTDWSQEYDDDAAELAALESLRDQAKGYASDWKHGATLIDDEYFTEYAEQLAGDIGAVDADARWPNNHIDWEAAAAELKGDYTAVDFDGRTFWVR
jgi:hypothetical protein